MCLTAPPDAVCLAFHDFDVAGESDGRVDLDDFGGLLNCFRGPGQTPPPECFRPAPAGEVPGSGSFALHGSMVDVLSGGRGPGDELALQYSHARYFDLKHGRFLQRDPKGYIDGANLYEAFASNPARFTDPMGTDYVRVDDDEVFWVIEKDGFWYNPDVRAVRVGSVSGERVLIDELWGGGYVRLSELTTAADRFWNEYLDLTGLPERSQTKAITGVIDRVRRGQALGAHGGAYTIAAGAVEGAGGGASIVANTFTFGGTDYLGWTESNQYQGTPYTASRISAVVARESLIVVATVGTSQVARGGVEVTKRTQYVARFANWVAKSEKVAKSGRAVKAARVLSTGMVTYDVASGSYDVGTGLNQAVVEGDNWGYLRAGAGAFRVFGGFLGARELSAPRGGTGYRVMAEEEFAGASKGNWADSRFVKGDPDEVGRKWLWADKAAAETWLEKMRRYGEQPIITEVPTSRPLSCYPTVPHLPEGMAVHVPVTDLGPATKVGR